MWSVPRMWPGTVAVLASGPSMSAEIAEQIEVTDIPTIVVNNTFRLARWADILYAADADWWADNPDAYKFGGMKVSVSAVSGVMQLKNLGTEGFADDPSGLKTGGNSGYQALHLAVHTGAKRVLLCGFDMQGGHWHSEHPKRNTGPATYLKWIKHFEGIAPILKKRGIEVLLCTPSAMTCFPFVPLEEALARPEPAA
jgi:hypothetical protein